MNRAATADAAGGRTAAAGFATDRATLGRVVVRLLAGMAGVDPLSRHDRLELPADSMEHRTATSLRNTRGRAGGAL